MGKTKVTLDTNILISAFGWKGKPKQVFAKALKGEVELVISDKQFDELERVLDYPKFSFTEKQRAIRGGIEKVMAWIKSFGACILNRLRTKSLFKAMFLFCLSYVAFMRVEKL